MKLMKSEKKTGMLKKNKSRPWGDLLQMKLIYNQTFTGTVCGSALWVAF